MHAWWGLAWHGNHYNNSKPQKCASPQLSTGDVSASQNVHNATTTPPTTNIYQIANAAQSCKQKCCMLEY